MSSPAPTSAAAPAHLATLERLATTVAAQADPDARVEALLHGLADRIKATSNDQNVQKLARALRDAAPALAGAVVAPARV